MQPARHHLEWWLALLSNQRVNIIGPRESAKTTHLVYTLAWLIGKNPLATHFIGSVAAKQSEDRLEMVRELIEHNERYQNVFPNLYIDHKRSNNRSEFSVWTDEWNGQQITYAMYRSIVMQKGDPKNPTLFAAGAGSSQVIGRRFSGMCLVDDPHSEANSATEDLRDKVDNWFHRTLLPCVKSEGRVALISTRWAETDLSGRLMTKRDSEGHPIWLTHETKAIDDEGNSYWPEYWPVEKLQTRRAEMEEVMFQLMYQNNPYGLSSGQFTLDNLSVDLPSVLPEFKSVVVSVDFAMTNKSKSDYSVFTSMARDTKSRYDVFVFDMVRKRLLWDAAIDDLIRFCDYTLEKMGRLDAILIERQALSLPSEVELRKRRPDLPVKMVPLSGDKGTRLDALAIKAQRGGLFIRQDMDHVQAMRSELIAFPRGAHDDICDSMSLPLQYWGRGERSAGVIHIESPLLL